MKKAVSSQLSAFSWLGLRSERGGIRIEDRGLRIEHERRKVTAETLVGNSKVHSAKRIAKDYRQPKL